MNAHIAVFEATRRNPPGRIQPRNMYLTPGSTESRMGVVHRDDVKRYRGPDRVVVIGHDPYPGGFRSESSHARER